MTDVLKLIYQASSNAQAVLENGQVVSATGSGDSLADFSVAAAVFAHLRLHNVTGAPTVTVKIQHSDDGSSWSDLVAFTAATADHDETVQANAPKKFLRAAWTVSGSGSCSVTVNVIAVGGSRLSGLPVTVAGARNSGEGALAALLTALAGAGLIVDTTTAS